MTGREEIARAAAGDPRAFEALMKRHEGLVRRELRRRLSAPEDIEDGWCEVFTRAWRGLGRLRSAQGFPAWLRTIAERAALEVRRARTREQPLPHDTDHGGDNPGGSQGEEARLVGEALGRLSDDRSGLLLQVAEGRSPRELAGRLGTSSGAMRARLHRARKALKREMSRLMGQPDTRGEPTVMSGLGNLLQALGAVGESIDDTDPGEITKWQRCLEEHLAGGPAGAEDELFIHFSVREGRWSMRLINLVPRLYRIPGTNLRSAAAQTCQLLADERVLRVLSALQEGPLSPAAVRRRAKVPAGEWDHEVLAKLREWAAIEEREDGRLQLTVLGDAVLREALVFGLKCLDLRRGARRFGEMPRPGGRERK